MGEELSESVEMGTGMTVRPEEPVMVLDVVAESEVMLAEMAPVPVDETTTLEAVSLAGDEVVFVSDSMIMPVLRIESVADAEYALSVLKWLERPEFIEEAALDKMLEKPSASDCVTAGSVAVAATPARSELKDDAKLESAAEASLVIDAVPVAVGLPLAPEITDEEAEETAFERSEAAEETTPDTPAAVSEAAVAAAPEALSDPVRVGLRRPPVPSRPPVGSRPSLPRMPPLDEAPVDDATVESSAGPVRIGIGRPPVPRRPPVGEAPVAPSEDAVGKRTGRPPVPRMPPLDEGPMTPSAVPDEVASVMEAEEVVDAVPSMIVDRPTVIAPRLDELEASDALELLSGELGPVGEGSAIGANPVVPTSGEAERVEITSVEPAVGETGWTGRPPVPTGASIVDSSVLEFSSEPLLAYVGSGRMSGMSPVEPTPWLAPEELRPEELSAVGWMTLLGAAPVGAAKPRMPDEELPGVGSTTSSGRPPVEPTDAGLVVRKALLKMGDASENSGRRPSEVELELKAIVGWGSLEGMPPPVDPRIGNASERSGKRPAELVVAVKLELEIVGWGSLAGTPPPVDPRIGNASVRSGRRPAELVVAVELELDIVGWGSLEGIAPPVEATKAVDELELTAAGLDSMVELD